MHDNGPPGGSRVSLTSILTTCVVLALLPLLFGKPVTTLRDPLSMAVHAYELSLSDRARDREWRLPPGTPLLPPGSIAFGTHDLYPLSFYTARDTESGDALVMIEFPGDPGPVPGEACREGMHVFFAGRDGRLLALISEGSYSSWPAQVFSVIGER